MWCEISRLVDALGFSRGLSRVEDEFKLGLKPFELRFVSSSGQTELWFLRVFLCSRGVVFGYGISFPFQNVEFEDHFLGCVLLCYCRIYKLELLMEIKQYM